MSCAAAALPGRALGAGRDAGIDPRKLLGFIAMVFGMFMAILDTQIVAASLTDIQAGLAASNDEISWVQTAYLVAEVVAIPLSGFLSRALGTRTLFAASAAGFTVASFMCGMTSSIDEMIAWRALQGFIGGGMIPTVFAATYLIFPASRQPVITPLVGLVATLAPTVGPTIGGYLTEALSWHWLFFINLVPGVLVTIAVLLLIDIDRPDLKLFRSLDWIGLVAMAGFLAALEYVLEEGPRSDWLDNPIIALLAIVSGLSAAAFFARVLTARNPIVDLRAFGDRNFALGSLFSFVFGVGLYGLTYLYPVYLAQIRGYDALTIGKTMFVSGLAMFAVAPVAGRLAVKADPRLLLAAGFLIFAMGSWQMTDMTRDWDFWELFWPQIFRGAGLMLAIVPITHIALATLRPDKLKNASGLFNLMRNLGGAIGLAAINTVLNDQADLHFARLHDAVSWSRATAVETLRDLTARLSDFGSDANAMALKQLALIVNREALVMAFSDVFLILSTLFVILAALSIFMRRPTEGPGMAVAH
jgi:DHA2 family multidrug resistance protein